MTALDSLFSSGIEAPVATRVEVPLTTYRILEQRIQEVRLSVLRCAARVANERSTSPPVGRINVSQADVEAALKSVAGLCDLSESDESVQLPTVPDRSYSWLERSLDALRSLVIHVATRLANGKADSSPMAGHMTLTADTMGRAWQFVWNNQPMRYAALTRSHEQVAAPAAT